MARRLWGRAPALASPSTGLPVSSYNPALSADGRRVAFESARGNLNFAKRYGQMAVLVRDLRPGALRRASIRAARARARPTTRRSPGTAGWSRSRPTRTPEASAARTDVVVRYTRTGALNRVRPPAGAGDASEPRLSADGRRIASTSRYVGPRKGSSTGGDAFVMMLCA